MTDHAPLTDEELAANFGANFYKCPNTGDWVYRWSDERLVLIPSADLRAARERIKELEAERDKRNFTTQSSGTNG